MIPINKQELKRKEEEIKAAETAALEASVAEEQFVPENVPEHLVQPDVE